MDQPGIAGTTSPRHNAGSVGEYRSRASHCRYHQRQTWTLHCQQQSGPSYPCGTHCGYSFPLLFGPSSFLYSSFSSSIPISLDHLDCSLSIDLTSLSVKSVHRRCHSCLRVVGDTPLPCFQSTFCFPKVRASYSLRHPFSKKSRLDWCRGFEVSNWHIN